MHTTRSMLTSAAVALSVLASPALGEDSKSMNGSACRDISGGDNGLFNANGEVVNLNSIFDVGLSCPVVKDLNRIKRAQVRVIDRNPSPGQDIFCKLSTYRSDGTRQVLLKQDSNNSFNTLLTLNFGGMSAAPNGSYDLECRLPRKDPTFGESSIVGYTVVEE